MSTTPLSPAEFERRPARVESAWLAWVRPVSAVAVTLILVILGLANIATRARFNPIEDGIFWDVRPEGVTAVDVAQQSPGALAGITQGDVLLAVNGRPVYTRQDVGAFQRQAREGSRVD